MCCRVWLESSIWIFWQRVKGETSKRNEYITFAHPARLPISLLVKVFLSTRHGCWVIGRTAGNSVPWDLASYTRWEWSFGKSIPQLTPRAYFWHFFLLSFFFRFLLSVEGPFVTRRSHSVSKDKIFFPLVQPVPPYLFFTCCSEGQPTINGPG